MSEAGSLVLATGERLFAAQCQRRVLEAAETGSWPAALWQAVEDAGFTAALVPEAAGGAGLDPVEALGLVRLAARCSAPIPLAETMLAARLLALAGIAAPPGPLALAPVARDDRLTLDRRSGGWRLTGSAAQVPWGRHAAAFVAVVEAGNRAFAALVTPAAAKVTPGANIADEPRDKVTFEAILAPEAVAPLDAGFDRAALRAQGAALRTVQIAGALERVLELTLRYAGERSQFGRPIAKFQAVQQNLAILAAQSAAAGAAADLAAEAMVPQPRRFVIASAKLRAGEAAGIGAAIAHQVHGAIGFAREHELHFSTRRLWAWREEFGNEAEWAAELGTQLATAGADRLWATITAA